MSLKIRVEADRAGQRIHNHIAGQYGDERRQNTGQPARRSAIAPRPPHDHTERTDHDVIRRAGRHPSGAMVRPTSRLNPLHGAQGDLRDAHTATPNVARSSVNVAPRRPADPRGAPNRRDNGRDSASRRRSPAWLATWVNHARQALHSPRCSSTPAEGRARCALAVESCRQRFARDSQSMPSLPQCRRDCQRARTTSFLYTPCSLAKRLMRGS